MNCNYKSPFAVVQGLTDHCLPHPPPSPPRSHARCTCLRIINSFLQSEKKPTPGSKACNSAETLVWSLGPLRVVSDNSSSDS